MLMTSYITAPKAPVHPEVFNKGELLQTRGYHWGNISQLIAQAYCVT